MKRTHRGVRQVGFREYKKLDYGNNKKVIKQLNDKIKKMERELKFCGCTPQRSKLNQEVRLELSYKNVSDKPKSLKFQIPIQNIIDKGKIKLTWVCLNCNEEVETQDTFKEVRFDEKMKSILIDDSL